MSGAQGEEKRTRMKVELLVYDLSRGLAKVLSPVLLGKEIDAVYHTSVRINSLEYYFGAGIIVQNDGIFAAHHGLYPYSVMHVGDTELDSDDINEFIEGKRETFSDTSYDLFTNNCNNFSDEFCKFLTGNGIPQFILDLPNDALKSPAGAALKPYFEAIAKETRNMEELPKFSVEEKEEGVQPIGAPPAVAALFELLQSSQANQS